MIKTKLTQYLKLMRLHKPIGIFLLLWPTLMAIWIASDGTPDSKILLIFILGVIVMRSAGCVVNDIADRNIDKQVSRTKQRPLTAGMVTLREAQVLLFVLLCVALGLVLTLNRFAFLISFSALILALSYPFAKRYTHLPQLILGAAFATAIPLAFAAIQNTITLPAIILFLATFLWTIAFDTEYAMVDREEDLAIGVKSIAILLNHYDKLTILGLQFTVLALFYSLGLYLHYNLYYYGGILVAGLLMLYQQYLIKDRNPKDCFHAFNNNNFVGASLFFGLLFNY